MKANPVWRPVSGFSYTRESLGEIRESPAKPSLRSPLLHRGRGARHVAHTQIDLTPPHVRPREYVRERRTTMDTTGMSATEVVKLVDQGRLTPEAAGQLLFERAKRRLQKRERRDKAAARAGASEA